MAADVDDVFRWLQRARELSGELRDPDIAADVPSIAATMTAAQGRLAEARSLAAEHERLASRLTPHHRVHGVAISSEIEEAAGNWPAIADLEGLARERVAANLATPCVRNTRTLLLCAVAAEYAGDRERSVKLEDWAGEVELQGYTGAMSGPRLRLALARNDLGTAEHLVALGGHDSAAAWFRLSAIVARLDALAVLGDRAAVEEEAPPHLLPGRLVEPFALRALGRVRDDEALIRRALERFESMELDWHAEQTRALLSGGA
jgi:hypothetical protein